jgi:hypothetical protein
MIFQKDLPRDYWNSPPPTIAEWAPIGAHAVEGWRKKLHPVGLAKVIAASRTAYNPPELQRAKNSLVSLRRKVEQSEVGSLERVEAERQAKAMESEVESLSGQATGASHAVFRDLASLVLLKNDLARLVSELESAVENCLNAYRRLHKQEGWDEPPVEYIAFGSSPLLALNDFLEKGARPALAQWEQACKTSKAGERLPTGFRPEDICWLLTGQNWQNTRDHWQG